MMLYANLEILINEFRGVVTQSMESEEGTLSIVITAECRYTLTRIIACENSCPMWTSIHSIGDGELFFNIMIQEEHIEKLTNSLVTALKSNEDIRENFNEIDGFEDLDLASQEKYQKYIKYLRTCFINGHEELSSKQLIDFDRYCCDCESELYTKADQIRTILEFDCPERIREIFEEIRCSH
jgi:hypothetical protein